MSYVLPCCGPCQNMITANFEFNALAEQQLKLTDQIKEHTQVTHRTAAHLCKLDIINETVDRLEELLRNMDNKDPVTRSSSLAGSEIKYHLTSVCDLAMRSCEENLTKSMVSMSSDINSNLKSLYGELKNISNQTLNISASSSMNSNPMLGVELLSEIKAVSASIGAIESKITISSPDSVESPGIVDQTVQVADHSGWRMLGSRKVWKADWTDYDKRKLHRLKQQKQAEYARRRKMMARNNNNRTHTHSGSVNYNNVDDFNLLGGHSGNNSLPSDRLLLAEAKERFSRPPRISSFDVPATFRPIQFQRGETLNPYPVHDEFPRSVPGRPIPWRSPECPSTSCEACQIQHSCFRRN